MSMRAPTKNDVRLHQLTLEFAERRHVREVAYRVFTLVVVIVVTTILGPQHLGWLSYAIDCASR